MADIKNRADFMDVELLTMKRRSICFVSPPLKSSTSDFTLNTPKGVYINLPKKFSALRHDWYPKKQIKLRWIFNKNHPAGSAPYSVTRHRAEAWWLVPQKSFRNRTGGTSG
uniref:Uncharacterized protein n=1 Tax=Oryza meridionalis TaxID=40149 RepID=A0A0E0E5L0_9ORYZ